jgi:Family of unknown function (DUF6262)
MAAQPPQLAAYQAERRRASREVVKAAIAALDRRAAAITFSSVAEEACVDRSWLYKQEDLAADIRRRRERSRQPLRARPERERASDASLRVRLAAAVESQNRVRAELETVLAENRALREELARLRGAQWEGQR